MLKSYFFKTKCKPSIIHYIGILRAFKQAKEPDEL